MPKISYILSHSYDRTFLKEKSNRKKFCIILLFLLVSVCIVSITSLSSYVVKVSTIFIFAQEYDQTKMPKFNLSNNISNFENHPTNSLSDSNKDFSSQNIASTYDRANAPNRQITLVTEDVYIDI